ncbi:Polyamine transporter PUT1 [Capsicum baccatum]|uniref:Polyamine transporter PUT1 n=1 Tax=Capsicum baccatum TaxID=33114 RepID=A0A2G2VU24_CAPBA|nr:Polyamine transporter PUT1 [Capsicum baccatum]
MQHEFRRNTSDFTKNKIDFEEPPPILSREEIWDRVRNLGPYWGFQQGWVKWISGVINNALYPVMFLDYLKSAIPALGGGLPRIVAILALTLVLTYMNYRGLTIVAWMAVLLDIMSLTKYQEVVLLYGTQSRELLHISSFYQHTPQLEEFQKSIEEWRQTQPSLEDGTMVQPSPADMDNMWITVVGGPKKGRTYRTGVLQSSSSPSLFLSPSSILQTVGEMKVMKMQIVELTQKYATNDAKFAKFEELVKKHMP